MKKRNVLNSPRLLALKRRKRRTVLSKILLLLVVLLAILGSLAYIFRIPSLNIKSVEIDGTRVIDADTIRANIEKEIAKSTTNKSNILLKTVLRLRLFSAKRRGEFKTFLFFMLFYFINSFPPRYFLKTSGIFIEPSACW